MAFEGEKTCAERRDLEGGLTRVAEAGRDGPPLPRETDPMRYVDAGAPDQLEATTRSKSPSPAEVEVFGAPDRIFNEKDGSQTVLFRTSDRGRALRVRIPKEAVSSHAELDLANISEELRQNYVWVTGEMSWTGRGYEIISQNPQIWRIADPQGQN